MLNIFCLRPVLNNPLVNVRYPRPLRMLCLTKPVDYEKKCAFRAI